MVVWIRNCSLMRDCCLWGVGLRKGTFHLQVNIAHAALPLMTSNPKPRQLPRPSHQTPDPLGAGAEAGPHPRHHHHNGLQEVVSGDGLHFEWAEIASWSPSLNYWQLGVGGSSFCCYYYTVFPTSPTTLRINAYPLQIAITVCHFVPCEIPHEALCKTANFKVPLLHSFWL